MHRIVSAVLLMGILAVPVVAQSPSQKDRIAQQELATLNDAIAALKVAEQNGAQQYAKSLYDEAFARLQFAQQNWDSPKTVTREHARLWALEALWASRAALAKARWMGTNAAIAGLDNDITRFGGKANVTLASEAPDVALNRGATSKDRIAYAQAVLDAAKAAGGDQVAADDLKDATGLLSSARKVAQGAGNSDIADDLSYRAEMMARRALYTARANQATTQLAPLQLQRTQLAQAASEQQAAAERARAEEAQKQAAALQAQLAQEQANRQAQQAQLDQLRQQVLANQQATQAKIEQDRTARTLAEQQVDQAYTRYETALASGSASDVDAARRDLEDKQIALRAIQSREQANIDSFGTMVDGLRTQLQNAQQTNALTADVLAQRQQELIAQQQQLDALRREREADLTMRTQIDSKNQAAIAEAQQRRTQAEAQAQAMQQQQAAMQQQVQAAQQAAQQATAAAQQAKEQAAAAQQQAKEQAAAAQQQAQQQAQQAALAQQQAQQQAQQSAAQAASAQAELEKARQQLAQRDAEMHQMQMQQELARLAATKKTDRGIIVTLPGIFFDTGKSVLKAGAKSTLSKIAAQLKGDANAKVAVEGHTDNTGKPEKNQALSEARANAVRDFLVEQGVPADKVTAVGKGEAEPIATNKTAAGRQQNRRVELIITQ